jgi:hypothetical protein
MLPALGTSSNEVQQGPGTDLHGFVDRFNSLVGQIAQEADEGLELALYEPSLVSDSNASDDAFDPYLGYPISAIPKPDRIHVLGGVIHRLSTIESVGSREQARSSLSGDRDEATASSDPSLYISSPTR